MKKFFTRFSHNVDVTCIAAYCGAFISIIIKILVNCYKAGYFNQI